MNLFDNYPEAKLVKPAAPKLDIDFAKLAIQNYRDPNLASEFHRRLVSMINDFNKSLDDENEVGLQLCNFGQTYTIYIQNIGYWNPSLITFDGIDVNTKNPVQLIQHVSQISILLIKVPKLQPSEPKKPIGFNTWEEFEDSKKT